jgi:lipoate-protein ligase A
MLCINQTNTNPYFNIASEEYLLKNISEDIFMLYVNEPSVIVGKHQNTFAEINYGLAKQKDIKVVRRLSGGGAVYHDLGNLNFTFIKNSKEGKLVDFRGYTKPIIEFLREFGIDASFEGHNSIYANGKKVSGNAEHVFKNRVMHHGTLLFDTNMQLLAELLYVSTNRYVDQAVKSVRANTVNLSELLPSEISLERFREQLIGYMDNEFSNLNKHQLTPKDNEAIYDLMTKKYTTWEWNFGYSPSYSFTREFRVKDNTATLTVDVKKGVIASFTISGGNLSHFEREALATSLKGQQHNEEKIKKHLSKLVISREVQHKIFKMLF